jgi:hypothetical protein
MATAKPTPAQQCCEHLDRFFATYHDPTMQKSAMKALRFLAACDGSLSGKPEGWAAGIVYFIANRGGRPCGVPGLLNADFALFFRVSMSVIRRRAAQVERALEI